MKTYKIIVRGTGLFPYDMLRYDQCYPATENDSQLLDSKAKRQVVLFTAPRLTGATIGRWESFGWHVVLCELTG